MIDAPPHLDAHAARILLVDDEPTNIMLLERALNVFGFANLEATQDPREVLGRVRARTPDLMILDLNMPHMNGFEVMHQVREEAGLAPFPILILTAQHDQEHRVRALREGANDYVTKPFELRELQARVTNLIEVRLFHRLLEDRNEELEERVRDRTRALYDTRLQIVRRLGRAAEYRDNETGLHIMRMSAVSALLAEAAGVCGGQCELILNASPMHDIGKIGVPDAILLKPGRLDEDEMALMRQHTTIGADILSGDDSELLVMARIIALHHHERWDGTGYPHGLAGEAIPLPARVVALADVFDALTSVRPYKKPWSVEAAADYIRVQAGSQFDPVLAQVFLSRLSDILDIQHQYADPEPIPGDA